MAVPAVVAFFVVPATGSHPGVALTAAALAGCLFADAVRRALRRVTRERGGVPVDSPGEAGDQGYGVTPEVLALVGQDRKIPAIKRYRELNPGTGLKEAKDIIDALAGRDQLPDRERADGKAI
jgi:hypothetical protein